MLGVGKYAAGGDKSATEHTALVELMSYIIDTEETDDSIHGRIKFSLVRCMSLLI